MHDYNFTKLYIIDTLIAVHVRSYPQSRFGGGAGSKSTILHLRVPEMHDKRLIRQQILIDLHSMT